MPLISSKLGVLQKNIKILGLLCFTVAAIFSKGFHHADEHFQILEFAGLKLGLSQPFDLPWEYEAQMRSALQPSIVLGVHKLLSLIHFEDPFVVTLMLRLLTALLAWTAFVGLLKTFGKEIPDPWLQKLTLPLSFFFALSVYNGVRFSSENWGGIFFVLGLCTVHPLLSGVFLGISFLSRFQMGLMIFGLVLWLVGIKKEKFSRLFLMLFGFCLVLVVGMLLDHDFYGGWPLTFWNYFRQNLLLGKATQFGSQPWYDYFRLLFIYLLPPFSLLFIFGLLAFFYFYPKHVLTFCLLPFLIVHMALAHKEARFLFPLLYFFPVILGLSFSAQKLSFLKAFSKPFWIVNGLCLLVVMFHPADKDTELYEAVYRAKPERLLFESLNPYSRSGLTVYYYRPRGMEIMKLSESGDASKKKKALIATLEFKGSTPTDLLLYQSAPRWIEWFNFNRWLERAKLWVVYWQ